jgi:TRAP-type C4-dicarboxylate transport system permease small subunit
MERKWAQLAALCLGALALLCWFVMFLAGTDVWHDVGRPDFWNLQGPPYHDLRAFAYVFYLLLIVLSAHLIVTALGLVTARPRARKGA